MAKNNNLTDFLTDVANAIRQKKGITKMINPQDFSSEIESIVSGGVSGIIQPNDVTFYNYDGTVLHAYTKDEFLALSEMPNIPNHEGLVCQGWNWEFSEAKTYVSKTGKLVVGASYTTDDGSTRLYINIPHKKNKKVKVCYKQSISYGVVIDWGDGTSTESNSGTSNIKAQHNYSQAGDYRITLSPIEGCTLTLGYGTTNNTVLGDAANSTLIEVSKLNKVEIGSNVILSESSFENSMNLQTVSIPNDVTLGSYNFMDCKSLKYLTIPNGQTDIKNRFCIGCTSLSRVSIPHGVTTVDLYAFEGCSIINNITLPTSVTTIKTSSFSNCRVLNDIIMPKVATLGDSAFANNYNMYKADYLSNVTSIGSSVWKGCYSIVYYDFSKCSSVPTLSSTQSFYDIDSDCKIVVPDNLYDTWIAATNWSELSTNIVKASNYSI